MRDALRFAVYALRGINAVLVHQDFTIETANLSVLRTVLLNIMLITPHGVALTVHLIVRFV